MTAVPDCGGGAGAQDAHSPHASRRRWPLHKYRSADGQRWGGDGRIRAGGRRCPLNVGGGIGRLCSFLAGSTRRLGRGSSHGHTTVMLCPWFTRESPQWARLGRCPPPPQIRKWAVDRTPSSWDTCFLPPQMHDSHALPSAIAPRSIFGTRREDGVGGPSSCAAGRRGRVRARAGHEQQRQQ